MLAGGADVMYRQALAGPHRLYVRVEVWRGGVQLATLAPAAVDSSGRRIQPAGTLPFNSGQVTATLTSKVARQLSLNVPASLYPWEDGDLLSTSTGTELHAFRGIQLADGELWRFPVFVGKIQTVGLQDDSSARVNASDRAQEVADAKFVVPENSTVGALLIDEWKRLVREGVAGALFGTSDTFTPTVPKLTWQEDRAGACDNLAAAGGAFWYPLADGRFVMRKVPWTQAGAPVLTMSDRSGGTVLRSLPSRDRGELYNLVTVTGERSDGTPPVYASASDDDPNSPTFVDGSFGVRARTIKLTGPQLTQVAQNVAETQLRRGLARNQSWSLEMVADASLELGDVVELDVHGRGGIVQVLAGFSMPLDPGSTMRATSRSQVIGVLEDG
jgi:hypothetical protein